MKKLTKVLKSIIIVIVIILLGAIGYLRLPVLSYYMASDSTFTIPDIQVSFTTVHDGSLYVGEFYREENYPTNPLHHVESSSGTNHSLLVKLDLNGDEASPVMAYSIRDLIQGACQDNGNLILSASYSVPFSHFYVYDEGKADAGQTLTVLGKEIPLTVLDDKSLTADLKLAPMSEEIEMYNGQLYTMCASASNKYIFGKLSGASKVYATDMQNL